MLGENYTSINEYLQGTTRQGIGHKWHWAQEQLAAYTQAQGHQSLVHITWNIGAVSTVPAILFHHRGITASQTSTGEFAQVRSCLRDQMYL